MNRRDFFRLAASAAPVIACPAALAELLAPRRTIFLPPGGGWVSHIPTWHHGIYFDGTDGATGFAVGAVKSFIEFANERWNAQPPFVLPAKWDVYEDGEFWNNLIR